MHFRMKGPTATALLPKPLRMFSYARGGGVSRVAKGADCKSAGLRLRRFESYLPHQPGAGDAGSAPDKGPLHGLASGFRRPDAGVAQW
jgi:hypothetical protein